MGKKEREKRKKRQKIANIIGFISLGLSCIYLLLAWIPATNEITMIPAIILIIFGIVSLIISYRFEANYVIGIIATGLAVLTLSSFFIAKSVYFPVQIIEGEDLRHEATENEEDSEQSKHSTSSQEYTGDVALQQLNDVASGGVSTGIINVTGKINIGPNEAVKHGIYDLEILGGSGNITAERARLTPLFVNFVGGIKNNDSGHPSKIRLILLDGDVLNLSNISKIKLISIPKKVTFSNQLGQGEWVVGRDIKPGKYKLSTNGKLDPEFENLGWEITQFDNTTGERHEVSLNPNSPDVYVDLQNGQMLSLDYDSLDYETDPDSIKLIFTEQK